MRPTDGFPARPSEDEGPPEEGNVGRERRTRKGIGRTKRMSGPWGWLPRLRLRRQHDPYRARCPSCVTFLLPFRRRAASDFEGTEACQRILKTKHILTRLKAPTPTQRMRNRQLSTDNKRRSTQRGSAVAVTVRAQLRWSRFAPERGPRARTRASACRSRRNMVEAVDHIWPISDQLRSETASAQATTADGATRD